MSTKQLKCPYCDSAFLQFVETESQLQDHIRIVHGHLPVPTVPTVTDHSDPELEALVHKKAKAYQEWQIDSVESFRDSVLKEKTEKSTKNDDKR